VASAEAERYDVADVLPSARRSSNEMVSCDKSHNESGPVIGDYFLGGRNSMCCHVVADHSSDLLSNLEAHKPRHHRNPLVFFCLRRSVKCEVD
jgi:hypothetical protein